jgi:hypothetical protein
MTDDSTRGINKELDNEFYDPVFRRVLQEWQAPEIPGQLNERILAEYRATAKKESLWRRFLFSSIKIPLPAAVVFALVLCLALFFELRRPVVVKLDPMEYSGFETMPAAYREPPIVPHTSLDGFQPVADVYVTVSEESRK